MIRVTIENERGRIIMGGYHDPLWRILEMDGLGIPAPDRNVKSYAGQIGQTCLGETVTSRTITLSGELIQNGDMAAIRTQAHRILNQPVRITIDTGRKRRKIDGRCVSFTTDKPNRMYQSWVMQFLCDDPRFRDTAPKTISVFQRRKLLDAKAKTPCMFSERTNKVFIINTGDYDSEPVFELDVGIGFSGELRICNNTTGQSVAFVCDMTEGGDKITINISERTITGLAAGDMLHTMTDDTFLSDFVLTPGKNEIEILAETTELSAVCRYCNYYAEAVL